MSYPHETNNLEREDTNLDDYKNSEAHIEEVVIARLTEDDVYALSEESLTFKSRTTVRLALILLVQGCNQAGYGIDWSVISGINAMDRWHTYLGFANAGVIYGTMNALMTIGSFVGSPFLALGDIIGRRGINFLGNAIVIVAAILQGCAVNLPMFMVGRFLLGFGSAMMSSAQYMGEVAPAHLRGRMVGIFGACFQIGAMCMNASMIGLSKVDNNWCWRIPLLLEALFPTIVCVTIYFLTPESPRYLILRGKTEKAKEVIAKYQTTEGNNVDHPLVKAVVQQIEESIENDKSGYRSSWDFRCFFVKGARYRSLVLVLYSLFQQWNGGGIIGAYLSPALDTVGITDGTSQLAINFGLTAVYFVFTLVGSLIIDKFKRRTLIFAGLVSFIILQTAATVTSWQYTIQKNTTTAALTVTWLFLYQTFSSLLIATMHNLYPVELLSLTLRAKGMGVYGLVQGAAGTVQNYGISVGIQKIGYKIWVVYIAYNTIQLILSYFIFPETYGLSLEEVDNIFETPGVNPMKMSMDIQKAKEEKRRLDAEGGVSHVSAVEY